MGQRGAGKFGGMLIGLVAVCAVPPAVADESKQAAAGTDQARWLLFSGADIARHSAFFYAGARASASGDITRSGILFAAMTGGGLYRYRADALGSAPVTGRFRLNDLTIGYQWVSPTRGIALTGGLRTEVHTLDRYDPGNSAQGTSTGALAQADLWFKPRPDMLVTMATSISSVFGGYQARVSASRRLGFASRLSAGGEAMVFGNRDYRQTRAGILISGIEIGALSLGISGGWAKNRDGESGLYGMVNTARHR